MRTIKLQFLTLMLAAAAALDASAATITVTSPLDDNSGGTLREALAVAVDGDTIDFALPTPATIALTDGALILDKSVTITGPGHDKLTVDGEHESGVFTSYAGKTVTISGLTIANGKTPYTGGGVDQWTGTLMLIDCAVTGNWAQAGGGGVSTNNGTLIITRCTLSDNTTSVTPDEYEGGGAIAFRAGFDTALTIEDSVLTGNTAPFGGGISILAHGWPEGLAYASVAITDSTLSDNTATSSDSNAYGGGIAIDVSGSEDPEFSSIEMTLENSTLSGNSATTDQPAAMGGGIYIFGQSTLSVIVKVQNSTLSGNWASSTSSFGGGGAIFSAQNGLLMVGNSTLSGNWTESVEVVEGGVGDSIFNTTSEILIWNTILNAGPSGANLYQFADESDPSHDQIYSGGYNLSSDDGGGFLNGPFDQVSTDPLLEPLADNGGPTFTHALLADSPAIDTGNAFDMDTDGNPFHVATDQRGVSRPQGSYDDIGAFEAELGEYSWSGVLPPVNPDGTSVFKARSTIPLKFMLTDWSAGITNLVATLSYEKFDNGVAGAVNESVSTAAATTGNEFRYDPEADQYVFNWSTKGLSAGTYRLFIDLGDGVTRTVDLALR